MEQIKASSASFTDARPARPRANMPELPHLELGLVPAQYMHDSEEARRSAEKLLGLSFAVLCTGHGAPVTDDPHAAIRAALDA